MRKSRRDLWNDVSGLGSDGDREEKGLRQKIPHDLVAEWREHPAGGALEWINETE